MPCLRPGATCVSAACSAYQVLLARHAQQSTACRAPTPPCSELLFEALQFGALRREPEAPAIATMRLTLPHAQVCSRQASFCSFGQAERHTAIGSNKAALPRCPKRLDADARQAWCSCHCNSIAGAPCLWQWPCHQISDDHQSILHVSSPS